MRQSVLSSISNAPGRAPVRSSAPVRTPGEERKSELVAVVGMPNVGKSTAINALRTQAQYDEMQASRRKNRGGRGRRSKGGRGANTGNSSKNDMMSMLASGGLEFSAGGASSGMERRGSRKGEKTGPTPGVTRHLKRVPLGGDPPAMLLDSPGVMVPQVGDAMQGCKLALCGLVRDADVPAAAMVESLLLSTSPQGRARVLRCIILGAGAARESETSMKLEAQAD